MKIMKRIVPSSLRRWVDRRCINYLLNHKNVISRLGLLEMEYSVAYQDLMKRYSSILTAKLYSENQYEEPTRIVWWCWLQEEKAAPPLCKACLDSLRRHLPEFEIKVLTEQNISEFVHLPQFILDKYKRGIISRTHFSNILRTLLLIERGGVWIDSTVYCTGYNTPIFDYPLFVYQNWRFDIPHMLAASSWLISARRNDPILCAIRDLEFAYWEENDSLMIYHLYHLFFQMATEYYESHWKLVPRYSNIPPHILQFEMFNTYDEERFKQIKQMSDFHKLTWKYNKESVNPVGTFYEKLIQGYQQIS